MPDIPTSEDIRAQFVVDAATDSVPEWDARDSVKAAAFVTYLNTIAGATVVELITSTTYSLRKTT